LELELAYHRINYLINYTTLIVTNNHLE